MYACVWSDFTECEVFLQNYVFVSYCGIITLMGGWTNLENTNFRSPITISILFKIFFEGNQKYLKITGDRSVTWPKWRVFFFATAMKKRVIVFVDGKLILKKQIP